MAVSCHVSFHGAMSEVVNLSGVRGSEGESARDVMTYELTERGEIVHRTFRLRLLNLAPLKPIFWALGDYNGVICIYIYICCR